MTMGPESKETEKLFGHKRSGKLPQDIQRVARRKLEILDAAEAQQDLEISHYQLAKRISVPVRRINEIVHSKSNYQEDLAFL
jgi:proteic killer suppression protein